jgi:hypothetical protein
LQKLLGPFLNPTQKIKDRVRSHLLKTKRKHFLVVNMVHGSINTSLARLLNTVLLVCFISLVKSASAEDDASRRQLEEKIVRTNSGTGKFAHLIIVPNINITMTENLSTLLIHLCLAHTIHSSSLKLTSVTNPNLNHTLYCTIYMYRNNVGSEHEKD